MQQQQQRQQQGEPPVPSSLSAPPEQAGPGTWQPAAATSPKPTFRTAAAAAAGSAEQAVPSTPSQSVVHALGVDTDGAGTVLAGDQQRLLIEVIDPGQRWACEGAEAATLHSTPAWQWCSSCCRS